MGTVLWIPGKILGALLSLKPFQRCKEAILIQDGYRLGDLLLLSPAIELIKEKYPSYKIDLVTSRSGCELVSNSGWFNECIALDPPWLTQQSLLKATRFYIDTAIKLRARRYKIFIDFQGDPRGVILGLLAAIPYRYSHSSFGAAFACSQSYTTPSSILHQMYKDYYLASSLCNTKNTISQSQPLWPKQSKNAAPSLPAFDVIIHSGASNPARKWPLLHFKQLINLVHGENQNLSICCIGGPGDIQDLNELKNDMAPNITVQCPTFIELEILINQSKIIVCHDSFMMHAGWALKKAMVILFGTSNPQCFAPLNSSTIVISANQPMTFPYTEWKDGSPIAANMPDTVFAAMRNLGL